MLWPSVTSSSSLCLFFQHIFGLVNLLGHEGRSTPIGMIQHHDLSMLVLEHVQGHRAMFTGKPQNQQRLLATHVVLKAAEIMPAVEKRFRHPAVSGSGA